MIESPIVRGGKSHVRIMRSGVAHIIARVSVDTTMPGMHTAEVVQMNTTPEEAMGTNRTTMLSTTLLNTISVKRLLTNGTATEMGRKFSDLTVATATAQRITAATTVRALIMTPTGINSSFENPHIKLLQFVINYHNIILFSIPDELRIKFGM